MSVIEIMDSDSENDVVEPNTESVPSLAAVLPKVEDSSNVLPLTHLTADSKTIKQAEGKGKATKSAQIVITRQLKVDEILHRTSVPSTFDVPRKPTAILVDLSSSAHLLVTPDGNFMHVDKFIRGEIGPLATRII
jgi:hypothetical protein